MHRLYILVCLLSDEDYNFEINPFVSSCALMIVRAALSMPARLPAELLLARTDASVKRLVLMQTGSARQSVPP